MPHTKNALNAWRGEEGEITNNTSKEQKMTTTSIPDTTDIREPGTIADVFAAIDECPRGHVVALGPGDFGYMEYGEEWVRPMSDFRAAFTAEWVRQEIVEQQSSWFGRWYDADGNVIPARVRDDDWTARESEGMPTSTLQAHALSAWRSPSGFLFVSDGSWMPTEELEVDGEPAFRFVSLAGVKRREAARGEEWLAAHPEVGAAVQSWATDIEVNINTRRETVDVWAERDLGLVHLSKHAELCDGVIIWDDDSPKPYVSLDRDRVEDLTVETMRELASALLAAIPAVEAALAEEVQL